MGFMEWSMAKGPSVRHHSAAWAPNFSASAASMLLPDDDDAKPREVGKPLVDGHGSRGLARVRAAAAVLGPVSRVVNQSFDACCAAGDRTPLE